MGRKSMLVLALGAALAVAVTAIASAKFETYQIGNLVLKADGGVTPKALPRNKLAPVTVRVRGKISTKDGTHPPALREVIADFDKNGVVNTKGLPTCSGGQLEARTTKSALQVCGKSVVGEGSGRVQISFPEQAPIPVKSPITVFNGGTQGGKTTLFIHAYITVPLPAAIVTTVTLKKVKKGRYGISTVSKVPVIAGGSGSVLDFDINFGKTYTYNGKKQGYIMAKCTDGKFQAKIIKALFKNEAGGPRTTTTVTNETIIRPCTPKG